MGCWSRFCQTLGLLKESRSRCSGCGVATTHTQNAAATTAHIAAYTLTPSGYHRVQPSVDQAASHLLTRVQIAKDPRPSGRPLRRKLAAAEGWEGGSRLPGRRPPPSSRPSPPTRPHHRLTTPLPIQLAQLSERLQYALFRRTKTWT
ncbi:hypothetical protein TcasGA2_TC000473 [Tribolium castaneum]|uniref:Uncharacterized protein n=1 Tax=Tribolium castaneum TaxID=7070 RepID=D6WA37_TRICA|nr:hypothetical protein TcasGA2_TC000473 [Tribolium castaneum]